MAGNGSSRVFSLSHPAASFVHSRFLSVTDLLGSVRVARPGRLCRWSAPACPLEDSLRRMRLTVAVTVAAAAVVGVPTAASAAPKDVTVQLLAMNDFHGRISTTAGSDSQLLTSPRGGRRLRRQPPDR